MEQLQSGSPVSLRQIWWHVLFFKTETRHWWDIFNPDWAHHCCAYSWSPAKQCWIMVDPVSTGTIVSVLDHGELGDLMNSWADAGSITAKLLYKTPDQGLPVRSHRAFQTCSTVLARILGVSGGAWRPVDLHRSLLADDAVKKEPF